MTVADWRQLMAVNVDGVFLMSKFVVPQMRGSTVASIGNIGSGAGLIGTPNSVGYCASKGAVISMTRAMAPDLATSQVRVNCVCPGVVDTPFSDRVLVTTADPGQGKISQMKAHPGNGCIFSPVLLSVENLVKSFDDRPALRGVSLEVRQGGSIGVVGESGSGKTTLARCIAGLAIPDHGSILFHGASLTAGRRTASQIQLVFQDPYSTLNPRIRIGRALAEAAQANRNDRGMSPESLLDLVGLPAAYGEKYPGELSGGERQRVAIARSLAPGPELLVCDGSVSSLDVSVQTQIVNLSSDRRHQLHLSLLFISHHLAVVRQMSDIIHVMHNGQIVESGFTRDVLGAPSAEYPRELISAISR